MLWESEESRIRKPLEETALGAYGAEEFVLIPNKIRHGHHERFIQVISHAQKKGYPVNVNIPTASGGLTPLHLAALQGHELLIKVLVGAYGADTSCRDHNGRKAWQYLRADTSRELKELAGALEEDLVRLCSHNTNNNYCALKCCSETGITQSAVDNTWKNSLQMSG
ncbi:ankyrin repeat domain-containing protein sowahd [Limosa lapponica baueri]|uniref:Ankyrin repeat domain-containing protein sowahd n=1 Tax=Limosa lapponica baueri TaxID=1758121 RepID=A0A2I0TZU4_LIMLA|nr:ankyrin repeat domain-containing protein sowahd [Limosa lapponica baueri]